MVVTTDEELMRRVQGNEVAALGEIFDRYQARLVAFLLRFCGDRAQAEDLAQESLWRVWENRSRYESRRPFSTWLFVVAKNVALNQKKHAACLHSVSLTSLSETEPSAKGETDGFAVRDGVREALLKLPPDQRLCIILHEYEGFSYREVGEILGNSEGAARGLAHRAPPYPARSAAPLSGK